MTDDKAFSGKLALVTGASRGIGAATAEALAAQMNVEQMRDYINADSLAFISIEGLYRALGDKRDGAAPQRCDACFTGDYPTTLTDCDPDGKLKPLALVASR